MSVSVEPLSLAGEAARKAGAEADLAQLHGERAEAIARRVPGLWGLLKRAAALAIDELDDDVLRLGLELAKSYARAWAEAELAKRGITLPPGGGP